MFEKNNNRRRWMWISDPSSHPRNNVFRLGTRSFSRTDMKVLPAAKRSHAIGIARVAHRKMTGLILIAGTRSRWYIWYDHWLRTRFVAWRHDMCRSSTRRDAVMGVYSPHNTLFFTWQLPKKRKKDTFRRLMINSVFFDRYLQRFQVCLCRLI